jgi:hypothetical protein
MSRGKRFQPEQVVNLLLQIEVAIAKARQHYRPVKKRALAHQARAARNAILTGSLKIESVL